MVTGQVGQETELRRRRITSLEKRIILSWLCNISTHAVGLCCWYFVADELDKHGSCCSEDDDDAVMDMIQSTAQCHSGFNVDGSLVWRNQSSSAK